jgi:hypothetical protein
MLCAVQVSGLVLVLLWCLVTSWAHLSILNEGTARLAQQLVFAAINFEARPLPCTQLPLATTPLYSITDHRSPSQSTLHDRYHTASKAKGVFYIRMCSGSDEQQCSQIQPPHPSPVIQAESTAASQQHPPPALEALQ